MLFPVVLVLGVYAAQAVEKITIANSWPGGFQANFCPHANHAFHGWKAHLVFSRAVDSIQTGQAEVISNNAKKTEYVLGSKEWDADIVEGECMKIDFTATSTGNGAPTGTVFLEGNTGGGGGTSGNSSGTTGGLPGVSPTNPVAHGHGGKDEKYDYGEVLGKSILFYEAQRSGKLPATNRIKWRGDSALKDGSDVGHDLTGGWYDAGDHVKFGLPMASTTTLLIWSLIQWKDAYVAAKQLDHMYDCVRWPLDYFMKAHTAPNEFYVQVGDGHPDHSWWGRPEDMPMARPAYKVDAAKPGSDVVGETAAAMAAGYIAFKTKDPAYAAKLLTHAKQLYVFATTHKGMYTQAVPGAAEFYASGGYQDEITWAGAWLYKATGDKKYLDEAQANYRNGVMGPGWALSWDSKQACAQVLLYELTKGNDYKRDITMFLAAWMPHGQVTYTPKGLAYRDKWGPNRYAANSALIALMAAENGLMVDKYRAWAEKEINYILGDTGHSFVVGFGKNPPTRPHHRGSSCPDRPAACGWDQFNTPNPDPQVLYGAIVGGPDANDVYVDDRKDYVKNEVATDYNSGFHASVAGLRHLSLIGELPATY